MHKQVNTFPGLLCSTNKIGRKELPFVIEPPFWRRNWFYALCVITLIGSIYTYVQFQTKKLAKENKILEQKVEERTAEVVKKKDELQFAYHETEEKNRDIMDSINYAKRIQYTLLANVEMIKANVKEHFILFQPKDVVSGDFYWAAKKDDRFYIAVCDSTGHGVPGAFMSLLNISFLNEAITQQNIQAPNEILNYVREQLINSILKDGAQDGMDGILLCIDKSNNTITYAAAHNNPVLISDGNLVEFKADKMPIGKGEKDASFTLFTIEMKDVSDTLYLYTDGYADQFGGTNGKKFKYKQLQQMLLANCDKRLSEQQDIFLKTFNEWKGNLEQVDDVLLIGIRV
jgi:serine phosphatase RsbU (regulator of sigma subunit)